MPEPDVVLDVCDDLSNRGLIADQAVGLASAGPEPEVSNARRTLLAERLVAVLSDSPVDPERLGWPHLDHAIVVATARGELMVLGDG